MQPARLWLVRHGQTDWNAAGRIQGHTPTHLNATGRLQAAALADAFAKLPHTFSACYASDLPRAAQTAAPIADKLALPLHLTDSLRERSFGPYEGSTPDQLRAARAALNLPPTADLADWTGFPGVESNSALWSRLADSLLTLSARHPNQNVLLINHGGVIARALYQTLQIPDSAPRRFPLNNGIVAILQHRPPAFHLLSLLDLSLLSTTTPTPDAATLPPTSPV